MFLWHSHLKSTKQRDAPSDHRQADSEQHDQQHVIENHLSVT